MGLSQIQTEVCERNNSSLIFFSQGLSWLNITKISHGCHQELVNLQLDLSGVNSLGPSCLTDGGVKYLALEFACTTSISAFNQRMLLVSPFFLTCSGLREEMELKPRQVCLFAWTDPTKPRKLTWGYSQSFGEHDLLKVNFIRGEVNAEPI